MPAEIGTLFMFSVVQFCQPPVLGTEMEPVLLTPSTFMWKVPPAPPLATRMAREYVVVEATLTVYLSHSPGLVQPRKEVPPASDAAPRSTASLRNCPPSLAVEVS